MSTDLIVAKNLDPIQVFIAGGIDPVLEAIAQKAREHTPDTTTAKGRKEIGSIAYKVAQSKTYLDGLGKDLVADWKTKAKMVDEARKKSRDFLDALKDEVRRPLTEWEEAEKARIESEKLAKEIAEAHDAALAENELFDRQREIERKEAEIARQEAGRKAKEEAERLERERIEREKRIAQEAAERAKRQAILEAERDKLAAIEAERQKAEAERRRQEAIEREKQAEIDRMKAEQAAKERAEAARVAEEKRRAADIEHKRAVNRRVVKAIIDASGIDEAVAIEILKAIVAGNIPNIKITY